MQKGFAGIFILIGILVVGLGAVGAWYTKIIQIPNFPPPGCYYQQIQCIKAPCNLLLVCGTSSQNSVVIPQTTPSPTPISDQTAGWKTYTDNRYNFSIKYPADWVLDDSENVIITFYPPRVSAEVWKKAEKLGPFSEPNVYFGLVPAPISQSPAKKDISNNWEFIIKPRIIDVGGRQGYYYQQFCAPDCGILVDVPYDENTTLRISFMSLRKENLEILNRTFNVDVKNTDEETFKTMLATFKFLDQNYSSSEGKFCGGKAGNLPEFQCPAGYKCQLESNDPDVGGKCVKL